jgi:Fic family protein
MLSQQPARTWPQVGVERHAWTSTIPADLVSRAVLARHAGPYDAALVPPIADLTPDLPTDVAALADEAATEIARFDAEVGAEVAPFAAVLLRSESASSSMIENLSASARSIVLAELGSAGRRNATQIVGNVEAMKAALALASELSAQAILEMHEALMAHEAPDIAGRWRHEQVWVGGDSYGPHGATFIPPHREHVEDLINDLVTFSLRHNLPVLTQAAIAHAQFETIHPFPDGNGRTGRALIHALLRRRGLTRRVTVPVSAGLLVDTREYFDALTAYRAGDPALIVATVAEASFTAMTNGRQLLAELRQIRSGWEKVKARRDSAVWKLADLLLRQPVVTAAVVSDELGMSTANALRPIGALTEAGVLTEFTGFGRNRLWQSREVLGALDGFAARAGRRNLR